MSTRLKPVASSTFDTDSECLDYWKNPHDRIRRYRMKQRPLHVAWSLLGLWITYRIRFGQEDETLLRLFDSNKTHSVDPRGGERHRPGVIGKQHGSD